MRAPDTEAAIRELRMNLGDYLSERSSERRRARWPVDGFDAGNVALVLRYVDRLEHELRQRQASEA